MYNQKTLKSALVPAFVLGVSVCLNAEAAKKSGEESEVVMKSGLQWGAHAGLGYDSNIYRAPSESYINYADPCDAVAPGIEPNCVDSADGLLNNNAVPDNANNGYMLIEPEVQSGAFIPAKFELDFVHPTSKKNFLVIDYKAKGDFYLDSNYTNANSYGHKFRFGDQFVYLTKHTDQHSFYIGGLLEYKKRLYLDRDSGDEQESSRGVDISERYTYNAVGLEGKLKGRTGALRYEVNAKLQERDYEDPVAVDQYDYSYVLLGGKVKYKFARSSKITLVYDYFTYDYDERRSRNTDGDLRTEVTPGNFVPNPPREYEYNRFKVTLRQRLVKGWLVYLDYENKTRTDLYQGYDDYTKDLFKVRVHYQLNKNSKIKLSYASWERDYPNGFAFDNNEIDLSDIGDTNIKKEYDGTEITLSWESKLKKNNAIILDFEYDDENSTDLRYDYDRYKVFVAYQWRY